MAVASLRVPAIITSSIVFFLIGIAAGMGAMLLYGYHWEPQSGERTANSQPPGGGGGGPKMTGMPGGPGMPGGGGKGKGKQGPSSKAQLAALIAKLDQLTEKPLQVTLSAEQKKNVGEQLKGLDEMEELSDDEAKKRLDALLEIVADQRDIMEAAGYRWPGQGGFGGFGGKKGPESANPFSGGPSAEQLKSLQASLAKK